EIPSWNVNGLLVVLCANCTWNVINRKIQFFKVINNQNWHNNNIPILIQIIRSASTDLTISINMNHMLHDMLLLCIRGCVIYALIFVLNIKNIMNKKYIIIELMDMLGWIIKRGDDKLL
ncbi:hypothetical protein ACJX0J_019534, partial [Zea mays]